MSHSSSFQQVIFIAVAAFLLSMAALGSFTVEAAIYKWQDEDGGWHFSEVPPDSQETEKIDVRVTPPSGEVAEASAQASQSDTENEQSDTSAEKPLSVSPEVAAEEQKLNAKNCEIAKTNLKNLSEKGRVRIHDPEKNEVRYLTEDERQQRISDSKKLVEKSC